VALNEKGKSSLTKIDAAVNCLNKRGPDADGVYKHDGVALGHTRMSIIDTSAVANQPMTDASGRYTIVYNGEFFNFKEHRSFVLSKGYKLKSESDTEVLLYLYIIEGEKCLQRVNGFFAVAIYDSVEKTLFIARDRMGVKPLLYYANDDKFMFASEMKALMAMGVPKELDQVSLFTYLQLNYIPNPYSIFRNVNKLEPGHFLKCRMQNGEFGIENEQYYSIPFTESLSLNGGVGAEKKLFELLDQSVQRRMISDVPLGAFLSGGVDSSVIVALATRHTQKLNTFSIGFRDEPMFDETRYANLVAKKFNTNHHVFSLTTDDLFENLHAALDYIDEPFADSSALNMYVLSKETKKHVTVALSGDGADELFGGYNKHAAEVKARNGTVAARTLKLLAPLLKKLPQSRNSKTGNSIRQLSRFAEGAKLPPKERYWRWATFADAQQAAAFLENSVLENSLTEQEYQNRKSHILQAINKGDVNEVLYTDMRLVLSADMLTKVDMMSMANSLEVRTPFLDYTVVDFAFSLPAARKIDGSGRKKILRDTFRKLLPEEIYSRSKQGFEVPLLKWFRTDLKAMITEDLLSEKFIREQGIFSWLPIQNLLAKLYSSNPGDAVAEVWALIVFQYWWKKKMC